MTLLIISALVLIGSVFFAKWALKPIKEERRYPSAEPYKQTKK